MKLLLSNSTVTFLFIDIQGSTPQWEHASEKTAEALEGKSLAATAASFTRAFSFCFPC
jgi:hypothetical protein